MQIKSKFYYPILQIYAKVFTHAEEKRNRNFTELEYGFLDRSFLGATVF